jgi:hypothetical protein
MHNQNTLLLLGLAGVGLYLWNRQKPSGPITAPQTGGTAIPGATPPIAENDPTTTLINAGRTIFDDIVGQVGSAFSGGSVQAPTSLNSDPGDPGNNNQIHPDTYRTGVPPNVGQAQPVSPYQTMTAPRRPKVAPPKGVVNYSPYGGHVARVSRMLNS